MMWRIERWLSEVFPGESNIYSEYCDLPPRELAIVAAAVLDAALAELLSLRLAGHEREAESFLGLDGDGRAPAGSFGARIQLALLVGLISYDDAIILRTIKELRNIFAHRVRVGFLSPSVLKITKKLHTLWLKRIDVLARAGMISRASGQPHLLVQHLPHRSEAGEGLLLAVFTVYHAYFHRLHTRVREVSSVVAESSGGKRHHAGP